MTNVNPVMGESDVHGETVAEVMDALLALPAT